MCFRNADAQTHLKAGRDRFPVVARDSVMKASPHFVSLHKLGSWKHQDKFITRPTHGHIAFPDIRAQQPANNLENFVAHLMRVPVVDLLELIHVDQCHAGGR